MYLFFLYIAALVLQFFYYNLVEGFLTSGSGDGGVGGGNVSKGQVIDAKVNKALRNINEFTEDNGKYKVRERYADDGSLKEKSFFDKEKNSYEGKVVFNKNEGKDLHKETLYDSKNNLVGTVEKKYYEDGSKKQRSYDETGKIVSMVEYDAHRTQNKETYYDRDGKPLNASVRDFQSNELLEDISYKNGNIDRATIYDKNGKISEKHLYHKDKKVKEEKFNLNHQVIAETFFDMNEEIIQSKEIVYDEKTNKVKREELYDKDGELKEIQENEYDERGTLSGKNFFDGNEDLQRKSSFIYDESGKLYQKTDMDPFENVKKVTLYQYENDQVSSKVEKDSNNNVISLVNYSYGESGKVVSTETNYPDKQTKNVTIFDDNGSKSTSRDYDDKNHLITEKKYNNDQETELITRKYEGDVCVEYASHDEKGNLRHKKLFNKEGKLNYHEFFDDNGNILGENYFDDDEKILKSIYMENGEQFMNEYVYNEFRFLKQKLKYNEQQNLITKTIYHHDSRGNIVKQDVHHT